jgi:HEAT repeat protein
VVDFGHPNMLERWLAPPATDVRLRFFAAWTLTEIPVGEASRPALAWDLQSLVASANPALQLAGAAVLTRFDASPGMVERLLALLPQSPSFAPSLLLTWSRAHPDAALAPLSEALRTGPRSRREVVAFVAGVLRWPQLLPPLQAAVMAPEPRVRAASVWAIGQLVDASARPTLRAALADDDADVRRVAASALARLEGRLD